MKYVTRDLLTLLISLFILSSCKNPSGIGLDNNPGDSFYGTLNDTVTLRTVTLRDDSALSVGQLGNTNTNIPAISVNQLPFGYIKDDVLGETQADVALAILRPESGDARLPKDAVIDSTILIVRYGSSFSGDTTSSSTYQLRVRQLDEDFMPSTIYYSSKKWKTKSEDIGTAQIQKFNLKDSINVIVRGSDGKDSTARRAPELRIRLNNSFIGNLFSSSLDSATLNTDAGFINHVKGLYLTTDKSGQQGIGGIGSLATGASNSNILNSLQVTYRVTDAEGKTDTLVKEYTIPSPASSQTASFNYMVGSVDHQFSTTVREQVANPNVNQTTVYALGMGGLRTRISFPYIDQLRGKKIAVNKAELVVYVDEEHTGTAAAPAPRLTLYREDVSGRNNSIPDGDFSGADPRSQYGVPLSDGSTPGPYALGGFYDSDKKRYVFTMTSFIQDVLLGKVQNSEVYLAPTSELSRLIPYWADINAPSRVVLKGYNPADAEEKKENRTKLNIYYTELE